MNVNPKVDWRFDPFAQSYSPVSLTERKYVPGSSPFWIQCEEAIKEDSPSTVTVADVTGGEPGTSFTEVAGTPAQYQFRVDYEFGTGLIEFNSADTGKLMKIDYKGLGAVVLARHIQALTDAHNPSKMIKDWSETVNNATVTAWTDIGNPLILPAFSIPMKYHKNKITLRVYGRWTQSVALTQKYRVEASLMFKTPLVINSTETTEGTSTSRDEAVDINLASVFDDSECGVGDNKVLAVELQLQGQHYQSTGGTADKGFLDDPAYVHPIKLINS